MKSKNIFPGIAGLCLLAAMALVGAGCQTFSASPDSLASVTITNQPMSAVQSAVAAVFEQHGFTGGQTGANEFTFNHIGTRTDDFAYGSEMFQEPVTVKVVVSTRQVSPDLISLGCNAWLVEAEDNPVFQDSHKVRLIRKWPYEQLLDDVQLQLAK